jgi:hypothetical protein
MAAIEDRGQLVLGTPLASGGRGELARRAFVADAVTAVTARVTGELNRGTPQGSARSGTAPKPAL